MNRNKLQTRRERSDDERGYGGNEGRCENGPARSPENGRDRERRLERNGLSVKRAGSAMA